MDSAAGSDRRNFWVLSSVSVVIAFTLVLGVTLASRFGVDPDYVASAVIDRNVPQLELPRLGTGDSVVLGVPEGRITVVNFWASWCPACRAEHDDLLLAAAAYESSGVDFIGVVYQDRESSAIAFLDELGWGYDYATDPGSRAAIAFGLRGVPETYFIDREGIIVARISGESTFANLSAVLDRMLDNPMNASDWSQDSGVEDENAYVGDRP